MKLNEDKLYGEKMQAQIEEWSAELDKLKAKAKGAGAEAGLGLKSMMDKLEGKIRDAKASIKSKTEKAETAV